MGKFKEFLKSKGISEVSYGVTPAQPAGAGVGQNSNVWRGLWQKATPQERTVLGDFLKGANQPLYQQLTGTPATNNVPPAGAAMGS